MKILVACEFSGIVRDAFCKLGHNAWSCDLLPSERSGNHYQGDVFDIIDDDWDIVIAHPPCTDIAVSGARWFSAKRADGRQQLAIRFFLRIAECRCPRLCIENPVGIMSTHFKRPTQYIEPWQFGHPETKKTCLWLRWLPPLRPTRIIEPEYLVSGSGKRYSRIHHMGRSVTRWKDRSRTFEGIAQAMADQWGGPLCSPTSGR